MPWGHLTTFGPDAAAGPATSTDQTLVAADYLERELVATKYTLPIVFDGVEYPQYGLVADAVLALDAAGTGQSAANEAARQLSQHVVDYVGFGDPTEIAAGSIAKLLNVAIAQGIDPKAFGGFDLVATLTGLEQPNGRFSDVSKYGDNSNTFGQSFALIGLKRAGEPVSPQSTAFLVSRQCGDGGFDLDPNDGGCTSDPDATAMAVQALLAVGGSGAEAGKGLDYLTKKQGADGGVGGGGPNTGANANSTGLAGQAFVAGGRTAQGRAAAAFLKTLQYDCSFAPVLQGGIAYDLETYSSQRKAGRSAEPQDRDRRSTSQALLAIAGTPLAAVTAKGSDAEAPALACPPSDSPTTTPSTTVEPTSTDGGTSGSAGGSGPTTTVDASATTGSLAQTGSDVLAPVLIGLALVLAGGLAVWSSRRRQGAHA